VTGTATQGEAHKTGSSDNNSGWPTKLKTYVWSTGNTRQKQIHPDTRYDAMSLKCRRRAAKLCYCLRSDAAPDLGYRVVESMKR
jgi:hypothetical protein